MNTLSDEDSTELFNICKTKLFRLRIYKDNGPTCKPYVMGRSQKFGNHRSDLFGYVYKRNKPRSNGKELSAASIKHPDLYIYLKKIADKYFPEHKWSSIQLNHNVTCTPHKDKHNNGPSIIFAVGDYIGSNLIIETPENTQEIDIHNKIVLFEGARHTHYNSPLLSGNKYSFVFYA